MDIIAAALVHVYNVCLSSVVLPRDIQTAKVTAKIKMGDRIMSNCRPESVLPVFPKGLQKMISCRIIHLLDKHNLLTSQQTPFANIGPLSSLYWNKKRNLS